MWRGPVIERKRSLTNALKWKVFTIHAKLIAMAAQKWWDPDKNPTLFDAIEKAKKANVPNDNIARAIKKWTWEDKSGVIIQEIYYEWYWVGWVGIIAKTLTDNKNRTTSSVRHFFNKYGWNLWETWAVSSFGFKFMWVILINLNWKKLEDIEEIIIESWADDYSLEDENQVKIIADRQNMWSALKFLKESGLEIAESSLEYIPQNFISITDFDKAAKIIKLIEDLEEDEDVEKVRHNYDIPDDLQLQVIEAMEKARFRT